MPSPLLANIRKTFEAELARVRDPEALDLTANEPSVADDTAASVAVAESRRLTQGYLDPTEPTPPSIEADATPVTRQGSKAAPIGPPVPVGSTTFAVSGPAATCGRPVMIVPAAGDRPRRVLIRVGTAAVSIFTDAREGADATTPAVGGYELPATGVHETTTQGPIYASGAAAWSVSVWIDNYPAPVAAGVR
jgi:hypothetical protein